MEPSKWNIGEWIAYGFGGFIILILAVAILAAVIMAFNKRRQPNAGAGVQNPAPNPAGGPSAQPAAKPPQRSFKDQAMFVARWAAIIAIVMILAFVGWNVYNHGLGWEGIKPVGLLALAGVGVYMLAKVKGTMAKIFGMVLVLPILLSIWSSPEKGEQFADNLGKTVTGLSDGVGEAGESLSELTVPETLRTKGEIELGSNEEKQVMLTSEPREIAYATVGQCFGADPIDKIGFRKIAPGKGEVWSKAGEHQFTLYTRPYGTCP